MDPPPPPHHHHHHCRGNSDEDQGLIFDRQNNSSDHHQLSYPCPYYVQSPSTLSHANSTTAADIRHVDSSGFQSPVINGHNYSSSRGSNAGHYFLHTKKTSYDTQDLLLLANNDNNSNIVKNITSHGHDVNHHDHDYDYDYDDDEYYGKKEEWWRHWKMYFSYNNSDSNAWICLQISWRLIVSFIVALLVFNVASRPTPPKISIQMARIEEFGLGEGIDETGVETKMLSCNCSINLIIDNNANLFPIHTIHPPTIHFSFQHFTIAFTHGPKMYVKSGTRKRFELWIGTKNKAMYGAGREMEDMLESGHGMPLNLDLGFTSTFPYFLNLINPKHHYQPHCLFILTRASHSNENQIYFNTTCTFT